MKRAEDARQLGGILSTIVEGRLYYAITFLGTSEGRVTSNVFSGFCGFTDTTPRMELRRASAVKAERMLEFWQEAGVSGIVINEPAHLYVFYMLGGNALVESSLAEFWMPDLVGPKPTVLTGSSSGGFTSAEMVPVESFKRAPTPKLRMRIIGRDGFRCRICGRRPDNNTDIELHVHHIRPWGKGGLSTPDNLITLCHTCHVGLDPHDNPDLFNLVDHRSANTSVEVYAKDYWEGVQLYRSLLSDALDALDKDEESTTPRSSGRKPQKRGSRR